jgi:hypothetical protein
MTPRSLIFVPLLSFLSFLSLVLLSTLRGAPSAVRTKS